MEIKWGHGDNLLRSYLKMGSRSLYLPRFRGRDYFFIAASSALPKILASIFSDNSDKFFELLEIVKPRVRTIFRTIQTSDRPFVSLVLTDEMNCFYLNKLRFN